ncbi:MAG: extracellular solute-binding protein [Clostridiales bacterium]|jgi:sorbitol/mannitol transport system substrate-binding protein|nr:extracellular solute-binding protein [Bacillota bacterium]NLL55574.1 extracellular solute-binding protein [Clostridiales bacterium]
MKKLLCLALVLMMALAMVPASANEVVLNIGFANNPYSQGLDAVVDKYFDQAGFDFKVNISVIPEEELRAAQTLDATTDGVTYDMFYVGPYEGMCWGQYGYLEDLTPYFDAMTEEEKAWYDVEDVFDAMMKSVSDTEGHMWAAPFYGESSFIMYNKEIFEKVGIEMPEQPTWDEIYTLAKAVKDAGYTGIVMRSDVGWGNLGAPLGAMQNAFGAQYYDMEWNATIDTEEMRNCWTMYKKLLTECGPASLTGNSYNECVNLFLQGDVGIYYDATSLCGNFEADDSPIKGKVGYAQAPTQVEGGQSGWLWNWSMAINPDSQHKDEVFKFILWCTSKDFIDLTLEYKPDGSVTPPASRYSTYEKEVIKALPYAEATLAALAPLDFTRPAVNPTPYVGLQYMAIVEFQEGATQMTQWVLDYLTDGITLDEAIANTQALFEEIAEEGGYKE